MRLERANKKVFKEKEFVSVKKFTFVLVMALTLIFASALSASAAQYLDTTKDHANNNTQATSKDNPVTADTKGFAAQQNVPVTAPTNDPTGKAGTSPITRIHQNYADNTNACASCHATHTAVGEDLLQWDGVFDTCMACHDGSAGVATYDVATGAVTPTGGLTSGGRFFTGAGVTGKSIHNVEGAGSVVTINAAPGGDYNNTADTSAATTNGPAWGGNFECTSCHNPHGNGGNFRLLDPNVNGFASQHKVQGTSATKQATDVSGGAKTKFVVVYQSNDMNGANPFNANLLTAPRGFSIKVYTDAAGTSELAATKYNIATEDDHTVINVTDPTAITTGLYVKGNVGLKVKGNISGYLTKDEKVTYVNGFNDFCGGCHTDYNTSIYNTAGLGNAPTQPPVQKSGWTYDLNGVATPYLVARHAVDGPTGVYSKAYRHTVGFNAGGAGDLTGHGGAPVGLKFEERIVKVNGTDTEEWMMSCMTCHVAHGTDNGYWASYAQQKNRDGVAFGQGNTYYSGTETFDDTTANAAAGINTRGSDLKRMPNMGACEACHDKSTPALGYNIIDNKN